MNASFSSPSFSSFYMSDCIRDAKGQTEADHDRAWKEATQASMAALEAKLAALLDQSESVSWWAE